MSTSMYQPYPATPPFYIITVMAPSRVTPRTTQDAIPGLSPAQLSSFHEDGYLLIPDALDPATISTLLSTTQGMLGDFSLADHPMTKFSTGEGNDAAHVGDDYFLTSGDKIRFFFEEGTSSVSYSQSTLLTACRRIRLCRSAHRAQSPRNQQDWPCPAHIVAAIY